MMPLAGAASSLARWYARLLAQKDDPYRRGKIIGALECATREGEGRVARGHLALAGIDEAVRCGNAEAGSECLTILRLADPGPVGHLTVEFGDRPELVARFYPY
jgi:hypothetical protein